MSIGTGLDVKRKRQLKAIFAALRERGVKLPSLRSRFHDVTAEYNQSQASLIPWEKAKEVLYDPETGFSVILPFDKKYRGLTLEPTLIHGHPTRGLQSMRAAVEITREEYKLFKKNPKLVVDKYVNDKSARKVLGLKGKGA